MTNFGPAFPKIDSLWKRDSTKNNTIIPGDFASPEFEALWNVPWEWTEKIDGTNIRYYFTGSDLVIGGRTDNAQIPAPLYEALRNLISFDQMEQAFGQKDVTLYGEGYGPGIQKGGGYRDTPGFILFDVRIGSVFLRRHAVAEIAQGLGLDTVFSYGSLTLSDAWAEMMVRGFSSTFPDHELEGIVGRPSVMLYKNKGNGFTPLLCKMKYVDISSWEAFHGVPLKNGLQG